MPKIVIEFTINEDATIQDVIAPIAECIYRIGRDYEHFGTRFWSPEHRGFTENGFQISFANSFGRMSLVKD